MHFCMDGSAGSPKEDLSRLVWQHVRSMRARESYLSYHVSDRESCLLRDSWRKLTEQL